MFLKKVLRKTYVLMLKKKWNMKPSGAELLGGVFFQDYKMHMKKWTKVHKIHSYGFSWDDWHINDLTKNNCSEYLKTTQYYAMHPINEQYSHWIDDKLTLKYLCAGTKLDQYIPKYYFQIDSKGHVLALSDALQQEADRIDVCAISELLSKIGELAFKRTAGSLGEGFYKATYQNGKYYLNSKAYTRDKFEEEILSLRDYLVTEYLHPHKVMIPFSADTVNTIRYLIGRGADGGMQLIKSYIRFGTEKSGFVENYAAGGVLCFISEMGKFESGNLLDMKVMKNQIVSTHPDTGIELKGQIPLWQEIQYVADLFGRFFPQMDYLGLDFVVTDKNDVKILEINSLTSLDAIQLQGSILKSAQGDFFRSRLRDK